MLFIAVPDRGRAQESHYWNLSYGTRSGLLSGVVTGSVSDLSATYYNPGALGLNRRGEILLSGSVYELQSLSITDDASKDPLTSIVVLPAPSFLAGRLVGDSTNENRLSYSVLTRFWGEDELISRNVVYNPDAFGPESGGWLSREILLQKNVSEIWVGITWSRPVTDQLGFGITTYGAYRSQEKRRSLTGSLLPDSGAQSSSQVITDYNFNVARLLWKAGVMYDVGAWSLGVTVTTPGIRVFGSGEGFLSAVSAGYDLDGDSTADEYFLAQRAEDMEANVKTPFSVGMGLSKVFGDFTIDVAVEWYAPVPTYDVMAAPPAPNQSSGDTMRLTLHTDHQSVINFGGGVQYAPGGATSLYGAFIVDRSSIADSSTSNLSVSTFDYLHISAGAIFNIGSAQITAGLSYITGRGRMNIDESGPQNSLIEDIYGFGNPEIVSNRFRVIFAFSYLLE